MRNRVNIMERVAQDKMIQALLDEIRASVGKSEGLQGNTRTNPHRARVAQFFKDNNLPYSYVTSFWIAFAHDLYFDRCLHNRAQCEGVSNYVRMVSAKA